MITVEPSAFTKVDYDADRIAELAAETVALVDQVADDTDLAITVLEDAATSRLWLTSLDPVAITVESGALENYRDPRSLGDLETRVAVARLLLELADRRSTEFGAPALDAEVTQAHKQAWDVNLYGRVARLGLRLHQPRFRYNFRNRHGFSDVADRMFDQLWASDGLTWARIVELSDRAVDPVIT